MADIEKDAKAFHLATGMLPPGRSESLAAVSQSNYDRREVRQLLWDLWSKFQAKTPDGGPAFPQQTFEELRDGPASVTDPDLPGMSLRDYFAGQAISPMLVQAYGTTPDILAQQAYRIADAMLVERARATSEEPATP